MPVYRVEVRVGKNRSPVQMGNELIGQEWTSLPTVEGRHLGTSYRDSLHKLTRTHNYHGALARGCSVLSSEPAGNPLEVRLVEFNLKYEWSLPQTEVIDLADGLDLMFDAAKNKRLEAESN